MTSHRINNLAFSRLGIISNVNPSDMHIASTLQEETVRNQHFQAYTSILVNF